MSTIVAATKNKHKIREIEQITKEFGMDIITRAEAGIPDEIEIDEDGTTFEENTYRMIEFMFIEESTPDEATPDDADAITETVSETIVGFVE